MNAIIYYLWYLNILLKRFLSICDQSYWNRGLKRSIDSHNEAHFHSQANNDSWRLNRSRFLLAKKPEILKIFYYCDCEFGNLENVTKISAFHFFSMTLLCQDFKTKLGQEALVILKSS